MTEGQTTKSAVLVVNGIHLSFAKWISPLKTSLQADSLYLEDNLPTPAQLSLSLAALSGGETAAVVSPSHLLVSHGKIESLAFGLLGGSFVPLLAGAEDGSSVCQVKSVKDFKALSVSVKLPRPPLYTSQTRIVEDRRREKDRGEREGETERRWKTDREREIDRERGRREMERGKENEWVNERRE